MNVQGIIAAIVAVFCGTSADPGALIRIAQRESALKPTAWGDKKYGPGVYAKKRDDLIASGNPWATDPSRWGGSFGLFQMMPAYFLRLWDAKADPFIMFDPRVSTVIAGRLWNRAVQAGARDFVEVRIFWAFGSLQHRQGSEEYNKRLDKWSVVDGVMNPPVSRFNYAGFGTGPTADQIAKVNLVRTNSTQPQVKVATSNLMPVVVIGGLAYLAYKKGLFRRYATA
jgi:hypothetical protein